MGGSKSRASGGSSNKITTLISNLFSRGNGNPSESPQSSSNSVNTNSNSNNSYRNSYDVSGSQNSNSNNYTVSSSDSNAGNGSYRSTTNNISTGSASVGYMHSYDSRVAELQLTAKINTALTRFREDTRSKSTKLENEIIEESRKDLEEFLKEIKKYNEIKYGGNVLNIDLFNIERENRKLEDKIHGFIVNRVSKRISLDDKECLKLLKLDAGSQKEKKLNEFYKKVLKEAVEDLTKVLREAMEGQTNIVEGYISGRIESIMNTVENKTNDFNTIQQLKNSDESRMEREQVRLSHFIVMCDCGLKILNDEDIGNNMVNLYGSSLVKR